MGDDPIDWNEVMHISQWYAWEHLKHFSIVLGAREIVAEAMLSLVKMDRKTWNKVSLATIVCNATKWAALKLYKQHKKHSKLDRSIAFKRESYCVDFDEGIFAEDLHRILEAAKAKVITDIRSSIKPVTARRYELERQDKLKKIERYESGFFDRKIIESKTFEALADSFGVTRSRAKQLEYYFWVEIRRALRSIYNLPLDHIGDLLIAGERIKEQKLESF